MTPKAPHTSRSTDWRKWCAKAASSKSSTPRPARTSRARCSPRSSWMKKHAARRCCPLNFLKQLIGLYGNSMQTFVPEYLEAAMDAFQRNQSAVKDAFGANMFADLAKRNMAMFEDASRAFSGKGKAQTQAKPSASEVDQLKAELDALKAKVDKLSR